MSRQPGDIASHGRWMPYVIGAALALGALLCSRALAEYTARPMYAILVAALAVSVWLGGLRSGLVTLAVGWALSPVVLETDPTPGSEIVSRWAASLAVSLVILWVAYVMRRGREQANRAARAAESSTRQIEGMQALTAALLVAAEPSDVARELLRRTPTLVGARGGALGLIEGDDLVIVDPGEVEFLTHRAGLRLPLSTKAPITRAAAEGEVQRVETRSDFEARFPDGAALAPYAQAAVAVPICVADDVRGSLSLLFDRPASLHDESESIALIAADLGGQALERAELYQRERQSRQALDRILRVAPRFHAGTAADVAAAICREARIAFGSDFTVLWRLRGERLELLQSDPEPELMPARLHVPLEDFPGLVDAVGDLRASFVSDVLEEARGSGLGFVRELGIRSSLRIPVTISGSIELILSVSWQQVVSEPDASTVALARRFADQAGLALEQLERRGAEREAVRRARETRRLLAATAALASATTPAEVTSAILDEGLQSLGAVAGVVACRTDERDVLEVVDTRGYREATIEPWRRMRIDAPVPIAEAVRENTLIAIESLDELAVRYPALAENRTEPTGSWLVLPLATADMVIGSLGLSFTEARVFSDADLEFAQSLARQAGQALDRAHLLASEYDARTRAEDMVQLTSALSRAVRPTDVVEALSAQILHQEGLDLVAVYLVDEGGFLDLVQRTGKELGAAETALQQPRLDGSTVLAEAVRLREPLWLDATREDSEYTDATDWASAGVSCLGAVPLVRGRSLLGVLLVGSSGREIDEDARELVERAARQSTQPLERAWLMEREQTARVEAERASTLTRRLQSTAQSLAAAATPEEVGMIVVREARDALSADDAALLAFERGKDAPEVLAQAVPDSVPFAGELIGPIVETALAGSPLVVDEHAEGIHASDLRDALAQMGLHTVVSVPVGIGKRVLGALVVGFTTPQPVVAEDIALLETIGRMGAQALDRSRLLDEELRLRHRAERVQSLTAALSGSLTRRDVAEVVVEALVHAAGASASALSVVVEERGVQQKLAWRGYDDIAQEPWREVPLDMSTPGNHALRTRTTVFYNSLESLARDFPESAARMRDVGHSSYLFVPLLVGGAPNGLLITSWAGSIVLSDEDRAFMEILASLAAQALDRARHFESERTIAETLQRSVLPVSLPRIETVQLAARYLPGTEEVDVGGDWFDAIQLSNGRLGLAVGDVVGKGVRSAATMAQLRNGLRAFALDQMKPSSTMRRLNRLAEDISEGAFATVVYAVLDHESGVCRFTSAGHPPPLIVYPDGRAEYVEGGRGIPLGAGADYPYRQETIEVPTGSTILFYTDGLVERRSVSIDVGLERLRQAAAKSSSDPELLVEEILEELVGEAERGDDIVVLALRLLAVAPRTLALELPANESSLDLVRDSVRVWLHGAPLTQADAFDVVLAAWEACANAIEHPRDDALPGSFGFRAELVGSAVRITVADPGPWLAEAERANRGLGLRLMRSLMSSVEIETTDEGTVVRLEKTPATDEAVLLRTTRSAG